MRSLPDLRGGAALALALALGGACSKTPTFYDDLGSGGHGGSHTSSSSSSSTGGPRLCANPGDCGVADTECAHPACQAGICGTTFTATGTPITAQVPGDCKTAVCDGGGHVTYVADPADADDGNDCTVDACNGSSPTHMSAPLGTHCGQGPLLHCDGMGTCIGCTTDVECGAGSACTAWQCSNHQCVPAYTPSGQGNPGGGSAGDCQHNVCDGNGGVVSVADNGDVPGDPNPCSSGVCNAGVPGAAPRPAGTGCPGGVCDGNGNCGQCNGNADCGQPTECGTPVCVGNHCSAQNAPAGTPTAAQTSHDCRTRVCDGNGGITQVPEDIDTPLPPDHCTNTGCAGGNPTSSPVQIPDTGNVCQAYTCDPATGLVLNNVNEGQPCNGGGCNVCSGGTCIDGCGGCCCGTYCDCCCGCGG